MFCRPLYEAGIAAARQLTHQAHLVDRTVVAELEVGVGTLWRKAAGVAACCTGGGFDVSYIGAEVTWLVVLVHLPVLGMKLGVVFCPVTAGGLEQRVPLCAPLHNTCLRALEDRPRLCPQDDVVGADHVLHCLPPFKGDRLV